MVHIQFTIFPLQLRTEVIRLNRYTREGKTRCDVAASLSRTRETRRGNVVLQETHDASCRTARDTKQAASVALRSETQCQSFARYRNRVDELRNLAVSFMCAGARTGAHRWIWRSQIENIEHRRSPGVGNNASDETVCEIFLHVVKIPFFFTWRA